MLFRSKEIKLTALQQAVEEAHDADKTAFFFDTTAAADRFYNYTGTLIECARKQIAKAMGSTTVDEIKEDYRRSVYFAMKAGKHAVFFFDKVVPNFNSDYFDESTTPDCIFTPSQFEKEAVYKATLKGDEDEDNFGNKGGFEMNSDFRAVVLSQAETNDEEYWGQLNERLPVDSFMFFKIVN